MRIIHFEDDKYFALNQVGDIYQIMATFEIEKASRNIVRLSWFYIHKEFRGQHYSKPVLRKIIEMLRTKDPIFSFAKELVGENQFLKLHCYDTNVVALNLYESFGFERIVGSGYGYGGTHIYKL